MCEFCLCGFVALEKSQPHLQQQRTSLTAAGRAIRQCSRLCRSRRIRLIWIVLIDSDTICRIFNYIFFNETKTEKREKEHNGTGHAQYFIS